jgi:hypothetical protein
LKRHIKTWPGFLVVEVSWIMAEGAAAYGGGEAGFPKNLFPLQKSTPAYRILHHTLIKHRETMISIS